MTFTEALENLGDGEARRRLDLVVGVAEGHAQPRGQPPADRRLAGAHHAYQRYGAVQCHAFPIHESSGGKNAKAEA